MEWEWGYEKGNVLWLREGSVGVWSSCGRGVLRCVGWCLVLSVVNFCDVVSGLWSGGVGGGGGGVFLSSSSVVVGVAVSRGSRCEVCLSLLAVEVSF